MLTGALLVLTASFFVASSTPIGNQLHISYENFYSLPYTLKQAQSFSSSCSPKFGLSYSVESGGPTESNPLTLHFNPAGDMIGMSMQVTGSPPPNQVSLGYYYPSPTDTGLFQISVMFRDSSTFCSSTPSSLILGDRLVVNPFGLNLSLPLSDTALAAGKWTKGSCFATMGYHWFYDLEEAPQMSWYAKNLLPIVLMTNEGWINAFFFANPNRQQSILPPSNNWWDALPLLDSLMCYNWCDSACTWHDTSLWSTGHVFLANYSQVGCPGGCDTACCPTTSTGN